MLSNEPPVVLVVDPIMKQLKVVNGRPTYLRKNKIFLRFSIFYIGTGILAWYTIVFFTHCFYDPLPAISASITTAAVVYGILSLSAVLFSALKMHKADKKGERDSLLGYRYALVLCIIIFALYLLIFYFLFLSWRW